MHSLRPSKRDKRVQGTSYGRDSQELLPCNSSIEGAALPILLIDDDTASCFLLSLALASHGWEVITATTVQEAEAASRRIGPEGIGLVIVDVHLSNNLCAWKGFELYTRWTAAHSTLPFLLMSGDPRCKTLSTVCNGSVGFLYKPFDLWHLFETVEVHLRQRS